MGRITETHDAVVIIIMVIITLPKKQIYSDGRRNAKMI